MYVAINAPGGIGGFSNTVEILSDTYDPNSANNTFDLVTEAVIVLDTSDVLVDKMDNPDPVEVNDTLTYSIKYKNQGTQTAYDVRITDFLPPGVSFISASHPGCSHSNQVVTCNVGNLEATFAFFELWITVTAPGTT